jgi:hypothetical protein
VQMAWPQLQSMSGIFSMASHCALQYFSEVVAHEQTGCAHFLIFSLVIVVLLALGRDRVIQGGMLPGRWTAFLYKKEQVFIRPPEPAAAYFRRLILPFSCRLTPFGALR